jgi:hypothetical protein
MDTEDAKDTGTGKHRLSRILTTAALICFALPFATVSCYGDTTVSGVQAATKIDLYPNDGAGEAELLGEEPPNGFAFVALVAVVVAAAASFGAARSRRTGVWAAAVGVAALQGLFLYAFFRSWGAAWPRVGFAGASVLLVAAAWAGAGPIPRWIGWVSAGLAASLLPGTVIGPEVPREYMWITIPVYVGGFIAVALMVGAIRASVPAAELAPAEPAVRPSTLRMVMAGIVGIACIAATVVGATLLMSTMLSGAYGPEEAGTSYTFALAVLAASIASSILAWIAGRAIVRHRPGGSFAPVPTEVGA